MNARFENRTQAGVVLAELLVKHARSDPVVLGMSKGGTLVAAGLARQLGASVDFLPVHALHLPSPDQAIVGAVAPEGICVLEDELVDLLDVENDAIGELRFQADVDLAQQNRLLRGGRAYSDAKGKIVILVDDVIASSVKVRAALLYLRQQEPLRTVVAAPVITTPVLRVLRPMVDELVAVDESESVPNIARIYANGAAPSDAEVRGVLGVIEPTDDGLSRRPTDEW